MNNEYQKGIEILQKFIHQKKEVKFDIQGCMCMIKLCCFGLYAVLPCKTSIALLMISLKKRGVIGRPIIDGADVVSLTQTQQNHTDSL